MAHSPIGHGSIPRILQGSSVGMVNVPDSFPNPLTNCREISAEEIVAISVSQLLANNVLHQGFVYKRANSKKTDKVTESMDNMLPIKLQILNRWQLRYVIIYSHYVVYYKDDTNKKPVGWFSLKDYNRVVRAEEMVSSDRKWPFKIIGMRSSARTWYFCAPSEREMKLWMACFKATMDHAIHGKVKQTCLDIISKELQRSSPEGDESMTSASSTGSGSGDRFFQDDETYDDLESPTTNMENPDGDYDDITSGDESRHSGGDGSSGSGGRFHPQLTGVSSAANAIYEVNTSSDLEASLRRDSYFAPEEPLEDYMAIVSDDEAAGKRVNSDPPRRHYRNNPAPEVRTTPKPVRRLPMSPGSRPKLPEPGPSKENYDFPGPNREPPEPPARPPLPSPSSDKNKLIQNLERQGFTIPRTPHPQTGLKRQGPDGDSFRHKVLPEGGVRHTPPAPRPRPSPKPIKPSDLKPAAPPKPPVAAKKTRDLLPKSVLLESTDKDYANELLRSHGHNGMYLIRGSARDPSKKVVMVWDGMTEKAKHYTVFGDQKTSFALDQNAQFGSLLELMEFYTKNYLPNTNLKLTKPCPG